MKHLRLIVSSLYILLIVCMGAATFIEKGQGSAYVAQHIYGAWWFSALWALLTAVAVVYFLRRRVRRASTIALHLSFVIILAGALLTHLTSWGGKIHIRHGETARTYFVLQGDDVRERPLPFAIALQDFQIHYHAGTHTPADFQTRFVITQGDRREEGTVWMNHIYRRGSVRLSQSSYDPDLQGSILSVSSDPWGLPVTYCGYALLFVALLWMLLDPRGAYRQLLRTLSTTAALFLLCCAPAAAQDAAPCLPQETAARFGQLQVLYNGRICPVETFALDFTKKLCGSRHHGDYTAEQVLTGFLFYADAWEREPLIRIKSAAVRERYGLPARAAFRDFFDADGNYRLGATVMEAMSGHRDKLHQDVMKVDDKLMTLMELCEGTSLKLFPAATADAGSADADAAAVHWYAPVDELPATLDEGQRQFITNGLQLLYEHLSAGDWEAADRLIDKFQAYQQKYGTGTLPTPLQLTAEHLYNRIPFATILFMVCLTMAFLSLIQRRWLQRLGTAVLVLSFVALSLCMALRWVVTGNVPMSNGYETMLLMAWMVMLVALCLQRRFPIILTFGLLLAGFFLLVSHISQMDPKMGRLMPVLSSPLLTVHVSIIMAAYALLSITFLCGITHWTGRLNDWTISRFHDWTISRFHDFTIGRFHDFTGSRFHDFTIEGKVRAQNGQLATLSRLFLYPAITCLGLGIFIGAIWANISWGNYWSWDPKETWALITFMVYAVPLHGASLPWLRRPGAYHAYMVLAFLTLLMTYFGVNYFLGGMHSYA